MRIWRWVNLSGPVREWRCYQLTRSEPCSRFIERCCFNHFAVAVKFLPVASRYYVEGFEHFCPRRRRPAWCRRAQGATSSSPPVATTTRTLSRGGDGNSLIVLDSSKLLPIDLTEDDDDDEEGEDSHSAGESAGGSQGVHEVEAASAYWSEYSWSQQKECIRVVG
jgi:hypothetical protein